MREYLFRGKRADNGEWVEGYFYEECGGTYIIEDKQKESMLNRNLCYKILPETVGQFTGLSDKNGVKIFEGDIIAGDSEDVPNRAVEWSNDYLGYFVGLGQDTCQDPLYDVVLPEVIGNLHDDPELI